MAFVVTIITFSLRIIISNEMLNTLLFVFCNLKVKRCDKIFFMGY